MSQSHLIARSTHSEGLPEVLERVLDKGLVIAGDIKIKLCDIELLSIQIRLLVCSVDRAEAMGLTWWWQEQKPPARPHGDQTRQSERDLPQTPWQHYQQFQQAKQPPSH